MRTNLRRGSHALTLVVLTAAVSLSGRVEAQQTGVFPLAPIRRKRVPCNREDPTYKIYKQQYFGYHPTCWRTFPSGWGCPSTEAPDFEKSKRDFPPGHVTEEDSTDMTGAGERGAPLDRRPGAPEIPQGPSPFETPPGAAPAPRPRATPPQPGEDPFAPLNRPGAALSRPRGGSQAAAPAMPANNTPELSAPAGQPAEGSASRSGLGDRDDGAVTVSDDGPLLGLPDPNLASADDTGTQAVASAAAATGTASSAIAAAPTQTAPPRRRFFGNLFSSLGWSGNGR